MNDIYSSDEAVQKAIRYAYGELTPTSVVAV